MRQFRDIQYNNSRSVARKKEPGNQLCIHRAALIWQPYGLTASLGRRSILSQWTEGPVSLINLLNSRWNPSKFFSINYNEITLEILKIFFSIFRVSFPNFREDFVLKVKLKVELPLLYDLLSFISIANSNKVGGWALYLGIFFIVNYLVD